MTSRLQPLIYHFRTITEKHPESIAISDQKERLSYQVLFELSGKVCGYLLSSGLKKGDRVAMVVTNTVNYAAIFYGIWAAGGVTVALNTQAKSKDILNWIHHSDSKWLFIDSHHPELAPATENSQTFKIVSVGDDNPLKEKINQTSWADIQEHEPKGSAVNLNESDLASIIYTSGTTGHPKGVTLSHGNLSANIQSILGYLELTQEDSILNVLPFYYSYGNSILHTHLAVGASIILENSLTYPHRVIERMAKEAVTGFSGVPSTFALLLGRIDIKNYNLENLRYLTQAGGPMAPSLTDKLISSLPNTKIFIMYGQTEASARLTYLPPTMIKDKRGSIGIAIPNTTIEICDKQGNPALPCETGEIRAKGANIMQGYWKDIEMTNKVVKDGWLYTGDLAYTDNDGYIYIVGRSSDMIKSGANRISPKEIEEVILQIEDVLEVAVIGSPDEILGEIVKAYVVPKKDTTINKKAIQYHCKANLSMYKIPKSIEFVDEIPKTASGKIQKFLLK